MSDEHVYAIDITPDGRRYLNKLPDKVYSAVLAFVLESENDSVDFIKEWV